MLLKAFRFLLWDHGESRVSVNHGDDGRQQVEEGEGKVDEGVDTQGDMHEGSTAVPRDEGRGQGSCVFQAAG